MTRPRAKTGACIVAVALGVLLTACGGGGSGTADTTASMATTAVPTTVKAGGGATTTEEPEMPVFGASGIATFIAGDLELTGDVVACQLDGNNVTMTVDEENAGIEVAPTGGGGVGVAVTGMVEWNGKGQATVDLGNVSISGTGSRPEDGAPVEDFTLVAEIGTC
jgi:hypothetical protein